MDNTTPRPWAIVGMEIVGTKDNMFVASVEGEITMPHDTGNAELIVRAVNSYDAMREALRKLVSLQPSWRSKDKIKQQVIDQAWAVLELTKKGA